MVEKHFNNKIAPVRSRGGSLVINKSNAILLQQAQKKQWVQPRVNAYQMLHYPKFWRHLGLSNPLMCRFSITTPHVAGRLINTPFHWRQKKPSRSTQICSPPIISREYKCISTNGGA
jgi:hypothetical protein